MCPVCMATAALIAGSVPSTGGSGSNRNQKLASRTTRTKISAQHNPRRIEMVAAQSRVKRPQWSSHREWLSARSEFLAKEKSSPVSGMN